MVKGGDRPTGHSKGVEREGRKWEPDNKHNRVPYPFRAETGIVRGDPKREGERDLVRSWYGCRAHSGSRGE